MTMKLRPTGRKVAALLFATSIIAAGCSSSKSAAPTTQAPADTTATTAGSPDTTAAASTTSTYAPDPTHPIKIGTTVWALPALKLKVARYQGIQAAVDAINAKGGIHGRPLQWITCDAQDPNSGDDCARKMVSEGVVATIQDANLVDEVSSVSILNAAGIPEIDAFVNSPQGLSSPNVFLIAPGTPTQYLATIEYAKIAGMKSVHFLPAATPSSQNSVKPMTAAAQKYGITVSGSTEIPLAAADYTPMVSDAASAKSDFYVPVVAPFQTNLLLQGMLSLGLKMRIAVGEGQFNGADYAKFGQAGGPLDGALLADVIPPPSEAANYPGIQQALDDIDAYYKKSGDKDAAPDQVSTITVRSWLSVMAFAKVADTLATIDNKSVTDALNTMKDIDLFGLIKWTPSTPGPAGFERVSNSMQYLSTVKDGKVALYQKDPVDGLASIKG